MHNSTKGGLAREIYKGIVFALSGGILSVMLDLAGSSNQAIAPTTDACAIHTSTERALVSTGSGSNAAPVERQPIEAWFASADPNIRLGAVFEAWRRGDVSRHRGDIARLSERDENPLVRSLASWTLASSVLGNVPITRGTAAPVRLPDMDEMSQQPLLADESSIAQDGEHLPEQDTAASLERLRAMTTDQQLLFISGAAHEQDDESIAQLGGMVVFDDATVRHAAVDTLIEIMSHRTGHFSAIASLLDENAVFMDSHQSLQVKEILSGANRRDRASR